MALGLDQMKAVLLAAIFVCGALGVLAPAVVRESPTLMSHAGMFASGVMLAGALVHLLLDADDDLKGSPLMKAYNEDTHSYTDDYPWAGFFCGVGFCVVDGVKAAALRFAARRGDEEADAPPPAGGDVEKEELLPDPPELRHSIMSAEEWGPAGAQLARSVGAADKGDTGAGNHQFVTFLVLFLGISLHAFLAGAGLGAADDAEEVRVTAAAILAHKFIAAFALGMPLVKGGASRCARGAAAAAFGSVTPAGIALGWGLANELEGWRSATLISVAAGSFLWVGAVELPRQAQVGAQAGSSAAGEACRLVGFGLMASLAIWA